ncbi:hypothetical protein GCK72_009499 [Caenorhabditis remanei]|uniref:Uncharacterized protein n=1 Tax=Caenorhabditis remanei TaxID=31234 RepID=A0A6A5H2R3_CAERE|nr:hypothetical protein GCK72_009499 [Caenorhabditis remanei]KAF1761245.1 hypothetical protein GCK72_009499 [Caenorhabditis remanei]
MQLFFGRNLVPENGLLSTSSNDLKLKLQMYEFYIVKISYQDTSVVLVESLANRVTQISLWHLEIVFEIAGFGVHERTESVFLDGHKLETYNLVPPAKL